MEGKVALHYGALIKKMWSSKPGSAVAPRGMKWTIGKFAPRFIGFQQHDAQELLLFVLDGLHEGLNRVLEKPYVEIQDSNNRPDSVVADEHWDAFLQRNRSIVVDLMMGSLKSTLRFRCGRENIKFDPYQILSLPIPKPSKTFVEIVVVFQEGSRVPMKFSIEFKNSDSMFAVREALSLLCGIPSKSLYIAEVAHGSIQSMVSPFHRACLIRAGEILHAFEIPVCNRSKASAKREEKEEKTRVATIGTKYDVLDRTGRWYASEVRDVKDHSVLIHYLGWADKWDEWIKLDSDRIRPLGTKAAPMGQGTAFRTRFDDLAVESDTICVHLSHRRMDVLQDYILSPLRFRVFGSPVVLFLNSSKTSARKLYQLVWEKVLRYAPSPSTEKLDSKSLPPFVLKRVKRGGLVCSQCPWVNMCHGHAIEASEELISLEHNETLTIDWNPNYLQTHFNWAECHEVAEHPSVAENRLSVNRTIDFRDCMSTFTSLEDMSGDSSPYCSHCKEMEVATKQLELWNTPPILLIHLKRLISGQKIRTMVHFPLEDFDPSPFTAKSAFSSDEHSPRYNLYAVIVSLVSWFFLNR
jgi:ubiquitin carboxyl-terminal hydrolase 6/32